MIRRLFQARFGSDVAGVKPYLAPDVVYRMVGDQALSPFNGTFRGPDGVVQGLVELHVNFAFTHMVLDKVMIDGNDVAVRWHGNWRHRGTGASAEFEGFTHLVFENLLLREYTNFVDTALVAEISGHTPDT